MAAEALYIDTSVALRMVLEGGTDQSEQSQIDAAEILVTSRLALVEVGRSLIRLRVTGQVTGQVSEELLADAARGLDDLWARCHIWEITAHVCDAALQVAPTKSLRSLDAIHLATYVLARRRIEGLELLTSDHRLADAARSA